MNAQLDRIKSLLEELKKIAAAAGKASDLPEQYRKREAQNLRSFRLSMSPSLAQVEKMKRFLLDHDKLAEASRIPDAGMLEDLLDQLSTSVEKGDGKGIGETASLLKGVVNDLSRTTTTARRTSTTVQARESAQKKVEMAERVDRYGRGMLNQLMQTGSFQSALKGLISSKVKPLRVRPVPVIPTFKESGLHKPGAWPNPKDFAESAKTEEEVFLEKYGTVKDLPLEIVAPLIRGALFDIDFAENDFATAQILDSPTPGNAPDLDFVTLLKRFAEAEGEVRYFYTIDAASAASLATVKGSFAYGVVLSEIMEVLQRLSGVSGSGEELRSGQHEH
jgi:hypothetical protein